MFGLVATTNMDIEYDIPGFNREHDGPQSVVLVETQFCTAAWATLCGSEGRYGGRSPFPTPERAYLIYLYVCTEHHTAESDIA